jgi:DNA-binding PadR family transcriptional regulator
MPLGDLEQVILLALVRSGGEAHGAPLLDAIEEGTGRGVSPGALYTVLDRLEKKGMVESWIGDSTPARGGRRRRVYRIRPDGAREIRTWYEGIRSLAGGIGADLDRLAEGSG